MQVLSPGMSFEGDIVALKEFCGLLLGPNLEVERKESILHPRSGEHGGKGLPRA